MAKPSLPSSNAVLRPLLVLALPVFAEGWLNLLVGYTDSFLTARFLRDDEYLSAMGLMAYALWLIPSLFTFVDIGATALISRSVGAGNWPEAKRVLHQSLVLGSVLAAIFTFATYFACSYFVAALQFTGPSASYAESYLRILAPAVPFIMLEQVGAACLRGAGDSVTGFAARIVVNLVNAFLSTVLVIGWGPFPKLGWEGLAIGTACGHVVGGLLIFTALLRGKQIQFRWSSLEWNRPLVARLLNVGIPGGCDVIGVITCHLVYMGIIRTLGPQATAAHSLGVQIEALSYLPGSAFSVAAATLMGQSLGAANLPRAWRITSMAMAAAIVVMSTAGLILFFGGHALAAMFTGSYDHPTGQITGQLLKVVALSMPFLAVLSVLSGALRGAGDTRFTLLITFAGLLGVRVPLAALLACGQFTVPLLNITLTGWELGVFGAWYAMVADVVLRSILVLARFLHGGWQRLRI